VADADLLQQARQKYAAERARRVRYDRDELADLSAGDLAGYLEDPYTPVASRPSLAEDVDAVVVGGGFGGLLCGVKLRNAGVEDIRIIDTAGDFGGVWYWNRYPGAQCDVEACVYMPLLEELGTVPTEKYAHQPEIYAHAQAIGRRYHLYESALFHTAVTGADWDPQAARWLVSTDRGDLLRARYLIVAVGNIDKVKLPAIPGITDFAGHSFHTSRWDFTYTGGDGTGGLNRLRDKRVAIVGTGATALQCVPHLGEWARELLVFQRTPSTVAERNNHPIDSAWAAAQQPGWQQQRIRNFTAVLAGAPEVDLVCDGWTTIAAELRARPAGAGDEADPAAVAELADLAVMEKIRGRIDRLVTDPAKAAALKPQYRYNCKRPGFHDAYLQTFNRPSVQLIDVADTGIERVVAGGLVAGGKTYEVDLVIWATGFEGSPEVGRRTGAELRGVGGTSLADKWRPGLRTLHGLTSRGFPNLFVLPGPQAQGAVTANFMHILEENATHLAYIVREVTAAGARGFEVSQRAEDAWVATILEKAKYNEEFQRACTPGRFNNEGKPDQKLRLNAAYGGGPVAFFQLLDDWRQAGALGGLELLR
jgi:cyclohexanone monooxygenase